MAKHGMSRHGQTHPLYWMWAAIIQRCTNPKNKDWKHYGGRGIKVCKRWMTFANWFADLPTGYEPGLTLDRINNSKGYYPGNLRWTTWSEQQLNRRQRSHCIRGHPFDERNTRINPDGRRDCRQCRREYMRRKRAAAKG